MPSSSVENKQPGKQEGMNATRTEGIVTTQPVSDFLFRAFFPPSAEGGTFAHSFRAHGNLGRGAVGRQALYAEMDRQFRVMRQPANPY